MKSRIVQLATLVSAVVLGTVTLDAQPTTTSHTFLRAKVPFAFIAGGVSLPAGEYRVYHPGNPYLVVIENNDGTARAMTYVHASPISPKEANTKLVFNKYGERYFLAEAWTERNQEVHQCFRSRMEQGLIAKAQKPTAVIVSAAH